MKKLVLHALILTMLLAEAALSQEGDSSGRSGGGFFGNTAAGVRGLLPSTDGGAALAVLGVGVVLVLGGLAVRKSLPVTRVQQARKMERRKA